MSLSLLQVMTVLVLFTTLIDNSLCLVSALQDQQVVLNILHYVSFDVVSNCIGNLNAINSSFVSLSNYTANLLM